MLVHTLIIKYIILYMIILSMTPIHFNKATRLLFKRRNHFIQARKLAFNTFILRIISRQVEFGSLNSNHSNRVIQNGMYVCVTCRTTNVLSLHGVEEASSSWTTIVFAASASPLLSLDELSITETFNGSKHQAEIWYNQQTHSLKKIMFIQV